MNADTGELRLLQQRTAKGSRRDAEAAENCNCNSLPQIAQITQMGGVGAHPAVPGRGPSR